MIFAIGFCVALLAFLVNWLIEFAFAGRLILPPNVQAMQAACEAACRFGLIGMAASAAMYLSGKLP